MAASMDAILKKMAEDLLTRQDEQPIFQEDLCLIVAKVCVSFEPPPQDDIAFREAAHGMAAGLFGEAYESADDEQQRAWTLMCESALRKAVRNNTADNRGRSLQ